ncbi:serine hydrolase domain-containing protein [Anaerophaga thermohalophila]|jgi:CubicO group peptidase (beta-lactamase class C family)|uniref:serine hydrolase domain-containing protein n=1 Tax=Anaerophaga thermohalophila TaxID=177400 RepID=UPI00031779FA|nr:serine hydrolase domain-containing protein [Anaerophaga thermohalophila]
MKGHKIVFLILAGLLSGLATKYITGPSIQSFGTDFTPPEPVASSLRISGFFSEDPAFAQIDYSVKRFLDYNRMAGASVAIAKDGEMVFSKGYGWADRENRIRTEPYHLFRIASVSKLITAAGIMKLVEQGKLNLNDHVFGPDGVLNDYPFDAYADKTVEEIKIIHLLNHSGGWTNRWGDPMFIPQVVARGLNKELPVDREDIIRFMLGKRLHFKPGTRSSYSNLGYAILGEVIEKVSGDDYESFIKTNLLYPLGIFDMRIGGSYLADRAELEVKYYEPSDTYLVKDHCSNEKMVPRCYGGNDIETLGPAGGWIASSTDLLRFMLAIDGMNIPEDILTRESVEIMTSPEKPYLDPLGWRGVKSHSWYRTGTLAGTSALMVRRDDGFSYVILFNSSTWKGPMLATDIRRMMDRAINRTPDWPQYNLFDLASNWNE